MLYFIQILTCLLAYIDYKYNLNTVLLFSVNYLTLFSHILFIFYIIPYIIPYRVINTI
jgi:hypothetical protein